MVFGGLKKKKKKKKKRTIRALGSFFGGSNANPVPHCFWQATFIIADKKQVVSDIQTPLSRFIISNNKILIYSQKYLPRARFMGDGGIFVPLRTYDW